MKPERELKDVLRDIQNLDLQRLNGTLSQREYERRRSVLDAEWKVPQSAPNTVYGVDIANGDWTMEGRPAWMVAYPIRLNTHCVDTLLQGGSEVRVNYSHSEYGYDFINEKVVPITWFPGQNLYVQEKFDIEPSGRFGINLYYRADYPNSGWRNWMPSYLMTENQSRIKLTVLHVDLVYRISDENPVSWILTVERR